MLLYNLLFWINRFLDSFYRNWTVLLIMFHIVEFTKGAIEVVPDSWLLKEQHIVYWPTCKSTSQLSNYVKQCISVDDTFEVFKFKRIMFSNCNYAKVRSKLEAASITSDLNTDEVSIHTFQIFYGSKFPFVIFIIYL